MQETLGQNELSHWTFEKKFGFKYTLEVMLMF